MLKVGVALYQTRKNSLYDDNTKKSQVIQLLLI